MTTEDRREKIYTPGICMQGGLRRGGLTSALAPRVPVVAEDV